jgi:hypothetical protein
MTAPRSKAAETYTPVIADQRRRPRLSCPRGTVGAIDRSSRAAGSTARNPACSMPMLVGSLARSLLIRAGEFPAHGELKSRPGQSIYDKGGVGGTG